MSKFIANNIRVGNVILYEGKLWTILKASITKPGKGGAYVQVEMKSVKGNIKKNERFRSSETITKVIVEEKEMLFLCLSGDDIVLMDNSSYEQITFSKDFFVGRIEYLQQEGINLTVHMYNGKYIYIKLPKLLKIRVDNTEAVVKGQTSTASFKSAILENGIIIQVPTFVQEGDSLIVNTEDDLYHSRS